MAAVLVSPSRQTQQQALSVADAQNRKLEFQKEGLFEEMDFLIVMNHYP